jgi:hypothetical protein
MNNMTGWNTKNNPEEIVKVNPNKQYSQAYIERFKRYAKKQKRQR